MMKTLRKISQAKGAHLVASVLRMLVQRPLNVRSAPYSQHYSEEFKVVRQRRISEVTWLFHFLALATTLHSHKSRTVCVHCQLTVRAYRRVAMWHRLALLPPSTHRLAAYWRISESTFVSLVQQSSGPMHLWHGVQ